MNKILYPSRMKTESSENIESHISYNSQKPLIE